MVLNDGFRKSINDFFGTMLLIEFFNGYLFFIKKKNVFFFCMKCECTIVDGYRTFFFFR